MTYAATAVSCDALRLFQLVDDRVLTSLMRGSCGLSRTKVGGSGGGGGGGGGASQAADGVRKFQMGSVPDRGGSEFDIFYFIGQFRVDSTR